MNKVISLIICIIVFQGLSVFGQTIPCVSYSETTAINETENLASIKHPLFAFEWGEEAVANYQKVESPISLTFVACNAPLIMDSIDFKATVQGVSMNRIELDSFPHSIFKYKDNLRCLDLAGNQITKLPDSIALLASLEYLSLGDGAYGGNPLVELGNGIGELESLRSLCLFQTAIEAFPDSFYKLKKLEYLNLNQTKIKKIPAGIGNFSQLKYLYLSSLDLVELPSELVHCSNLQELGLNNCLALNLDQALGVINNLPNLELLDLSSIGLTKFPDLLAANSTIKDLDLSGNPLSYKELRYALKKMPQLEKLRFRSCRLSFNEKEKLKKEFEAIAFDFKHCR
jgi:Leucine-rich repeat (LRR) protein